MMKKLHFKSWLLLMLCMLVGGVNSASAEDKQNVSTVSTTFSATGDVTSKFTQTGDFTNANWSLAVTWKSGTSWQAMNNTKGSQVGSGSKPATSIVLTGTNIPGTIKSVKVNSSVASGGTTTVGVVVGSTTFQCNNGNTATLQTSAADYTFTGEASGDVVLTWTQSSTSKAIYIKSVTITYEEADPSDTRVATTVTIDATGITNTNVFNGTDAGSLSATVKDGETTIDGASVTWSSETESVATIDASTGAVTLVGAGSTVITATYEGDETNYKPSSATYTLTVTNEDPNAPGTANNPYTVAQAIENTPSSGTSANVYIKGKVSAFYSTDIVSDGTNYRYYISDDGTTTNQLLVYRGKGLNNVAFSSADDLQIGDQVVIYGGLTTYNSTKEVAANNYIVSLSRKPTPTITFKDGNNEEITSVDVAMNDMVEVSATCSAGDVTLTFSSEDATIADYDDGYVLGYKDGTTTITASFAGNDDYWATTAQLTVNVTDSRSAVTLAFENVPETINLDATATYTATATPAVTGITYSSSDDNIVMVDDETGEIAAMAVGTATITASFGGDSQYKPAEASYTIKVVDPNAKVNVYEKVTSTAGITDGEYLIVYAGDETHSSVAFNGALKTLDAANNGVAVSIANNEIEGSDEIDAATFTITAVEGGYTIVSASGLYIDKTANSNGLDAKTTEMVNKSITIDGSGNAVITASGGCTLRYNYASDNLRFRYYKSGQQAVQLYKKVVELPDITLTDDSDSDNSSIISANDGQKVNATVERTLSPDYYNTLFLPFAMSAEQITAAFGDGAQVATFTGTASNGTTFNFQNVTEMAAHKAYLVKPAATVNGFTVEGATIVEEPTIITPSVMGDNYSFDGTLDSYTYKGTAGTPTAVYYFTTSGTVKKLATNGTIKGLRAYMRSTSAISSGSGGGGRAPEEFFISFGDDVTAINAIDGVPVLDANAPLYNLAGQRVGQSYKGVVIQNGKKFVIK